MEGEEAPFLRFRFSGWLSDRFRVEKTFPRGATSAWMLGVKYKFAGESRPHWSYVDGVVCVREDISASRLTEKFPHYAWEVEPKGFMELVYYYNARALEHDGHILHSCGREEYKRALNLAVKQREDKETLDRSVDQKVPEPLPPKVTVTGTHYGMYTIGIHAYGKYSMHKLYPGELRRAIESYVSDFEL